MTQHNVGDMVFSRRYGMGTVIQIVEWRLGHAEPVKDYLVQWHGGLYGLAEEYVQQLDALAVMLAKQKFVEVSERYTTGSVADICRWEKIRFEAQGAV